MADTAEDPFALDNTFDTVIEDEEDAEVVPGEDVDPSTINTNEEAGENVQDEQMGEEEDGMELTVEAIEAIKRRKKLQKREEKKRKDELLRNIGKDTARVSVDRKSIKSSILKERTSEEDKFTQSLIMSGTYDRQVLEELKEESLSSSEDTEERKPCSVSFKDNFLINFTFPSMSDLTTSSDVPHSSITRSTSVRQEEAVDVDVGEFVDPVTGEVLPEPEQPVADQASIESVAVTEPVVETESSSSISFDWPFPLEDVIAPSAKTADIDVMDFDVLMDVRGSSRYLHAESTTEMEFIRTVREIRAITTDFLFKLFDDVVEACEYIDPKVVLRQKLEKEKLLDELHKQIRNYLVAKRFNQDLQQKMFEYYRRVGQLRCFQELPPPVEKIEYYRLREALTHFDHLRKKFALTKKKNSYLISSVNMDMTYQFDIDQRTTQSFEKRIRETLIRKEDEFLPRVVENELRRIQNLRNEISDSRLRLITRQHTLGRLCERKHNFDQITDELTMDEFLATQRDVSALGIKVEERNHDLIRMRDRCIKNSHQLAFVKEKITILSARLIDAKANLAIKSKRHDQLREKLFVLKVDNVNLKTVNHEVHSKAGILFKPVLLEDYDNTMDFVLNKRTEVERLKLVLSDLETRIAIVEQQRRVTPNQTTRRRRPARKNT